MTRGFTLIELVVSVALFSVVMAGIGSISMAVLRHQTRLLVASSFDNATTLARRSLTAALQDATYVAAPPSGIAGGVLTTWTNLDDDGVTRIVPGRPSRFTHHCVSADASLLHFYSGAAPMPAIACGGDYSGVFHTVLAGGAGYRLAARFYRPPEAANLVEAGVSLSLLRADGSRRDADVQVKVITRHAKD